jgi:hypothetical protein
MSPWDRIFRLSLVPFTQSTGFLLCHSIHNQLCPPAYQRAASTWILTWLHSTTSHYPNCQQHRRILTFHPKTLCQFPLDSNMMKLPRHPHRIYATVPRPRRSTSAPTRSAISGSTGSTNYTDIIAVPMRKSCLFHAVLMVARERREGSRGRTRGMITSGRCMGSVRLSMDSWTVARRMFLYRVMSCSTRVCFGMLSL